MTPRRSWATALMTMAVVLAATVTAGAETWPSRPIKVISPFTAGNAGDTVARIVFDRVSKQLGQALLIENKPGAAGVIGSKYVIASPADGYTLLYTPSSLSLSVVVRETPPYDVSKDFTPIINVAISPYALVVTPSLPVHNLKEFTTYAKANPG